MAVLTDIPGLGTQWSFKFFTEVETSSLRLDLERYIRDFEKLYSRFDADSLLSTLNRKKQLSNPPLDLVRMCRLGQDYYELSGGLFNIATETHQRAQGYDAEYSFAPRLDVVPETTDVRQSIGVRENKITIDPNVTLDLGGLGKGYLIDKLAVYLQEKLGLHYFVINGGGDIYVTSNLGQPVETYLRDPRDPKRALQKVFLRNQSLCASSPHLRRWRDKTHLLDPLDLSRRVTQSAFVIARTATEADVLATIATLTTSENFARLTRILKIKFWII